MAEDRPVLVVGAGPVGMVAAVALLRRSVPVTVLEAGAELSGEMRGSTFHAPTLDMLDDLGAAPAMIAAHTTTLAIEAHSEMWSPYGVSPPVIG